MLKNRDVNRFPRQAIVLDFPTMGGINHDAVIRHDQAPRGLAFGIRPLAAGGEVVNAASAPIELLVNQA